MNVDAYIRALGFDGFIYGCGTEVELNGETLYHLSQTPECSAAIAELAVRTGVTPLYEGADTVYYDRRARQDPNLDAMLSLYQNKRAALCPVPVNEPWSMDKFVVWYDEESKLSQFRRGIAGQFQWIDRGDGFAELVPEGCSKGTGMQILLQNAPVPKEEIYAFGDSLNDLPMLQMAGTGVAMGDPSLLQPYADYVTDPLRSDGLAHAFQHFHLI